jgi:hypothetical protein
MTNFFGKHQGVRLVFFGELFLGVKRRFKREDYPFTVYNDPENVLFNRHADIINNIYYNLDRTERKER